MKLEKTMQCVVKTKPGAGNIALEERPVPTPGPKDILVKVAAAAVCGTDVHIDVWNDWAAKRMTGGKIFGHEFAGEVVEVGAEVESVKVGDIVSAETHIVCHSCDLCLAGHFHVCRNTQLIGITRDGCFAEYISIPAENAFICGGALKKLPVEVLSVFEPFGVAVHAAMEFPLAGRDVAITGCGPIGAMACAVAKKLGARKVIAVELNAYRTKLAKTLGADFAVNPVESDPIKQMMEITDGKGVDVVLEFSGNPRAIETAMKYCKPEAQIAAAGLPDLPVSLEFAEFVYRGLSLKGIAGRLMYRNWQQAAGLLEAGLDINPIITHTLPLTDYAEGLRLMKNGECGKVILKP